MIDELKKKNVALSRKEVILLDTIDALRCQIETDKHVHEDTQDELNNLKKSGKMLYSGSKNLDSILGAQRTSGSYKGLGFTCGSGFGKTTFVKTEPQTYKEPTNHHSQSRTRRYPPRRQESRRCYFCNRVDQTDVRNSTSFSKRWIKCQNLG
ncbi:unnamed protein product [Rhodiola kirilowii]